MPLAYDPSYYYDTLQRQQTAGQITTGRPMDPRTMAAGVQQESALRYEATRDDANRNIAQSQWQQKMDFDKENMASNRRSAAIGGVTSLAGTLVGADIIANKGAMTKAAYKGVKDWVTTAKAATIGGAAGFGGGMAAATFQPTIAQGASFAPAFGEQTVSGMAFDASGSLVPTYETLMSGGSQAAAATMAESSAATLGASEAAAAAAAAGTAAATGGFWATASAAAPWGAGVLILDKVLGGPISKSIGTWVCTEIEKRFGFDNENVDALSRLRRYAIKNYRAESEPYFKNGKVLVEAMNSDKAIDKEYLKLKTTLVGRCTKLVQKERLEDAYQHYKNMMETLCFKYNVKLAEKEAD